MSLIYNQRILDLGEHGVLALTLGSTWQSPLPAHKLGYARWHRLNDTVVDCFAQCTRHVPREVLTAQSEENRTKFAGAVPSVQGRTKWLFDEICDDFFEAPTDAYALEDGRALLMFFSTAPHTFRMVDIVHSKILWEETADNLCKRLQINRPAYMRGNAPVIYGAGSQYICVYLGDPAPILRVSEDGMEAVDFPISTNWFGSDVCVAKSLLLIRSSESGDVQIASLNDGGKVLAYSSALKRKSPASLACARDADRFALSHPGGTIEIVDGNGKQEMRLRPFPRAGGKDTLGIIFSPNGRFLVVEGDTVKLVDIEKMMVTDVALPDCSVSSDRMHFSPDVIYRAAWAVTDRGGVVLENKTLLTTPFDALTWQMLAAEDSDRKTPNRVAKSKLDQLIEPWCKPAIALEPVAGKPQGRSKLYGLPHVPADVPLPLHDGRPMLLLCQLDLAELAQFVTDNLLPKRGGLLFFVAVDDEGEPVLDDAFNPAETKVLWVEAYRPLPYCEPDGSSPSKVRHFSV